MINTIITLLATLTLISNVFVVGFFIFFIAGKIARKDYLKKLIKLVSPYSYQLVLLISLVSAAGSLFLSEAAGIPPCLLCWYQRIFMYPQIFMIYLANIRAEKVITPYLLLLNVIGAGIALYHYFIQIFPSSSILPCVVGGTVSCTKTFTLHYWYITIPMMSLTAFILNIILLTFFQTKDSIKKKIR